MSFWYLTPATVNTRLRMLSLNEENILVQIVVLTALRGVGVEGSYFSLFIFRASK